MHLHHQPKNRITNMVSAKHFTIFFFLLLSVNLSFARRCSSCSDIDRPIEPTAHVSPPTPDASGDKDRIIRSGPYLLRNPEDGRDGMEPTSAHFGKPDSVYVPKPPAYYQELDGQQVYEEPPPEKDD